MGDNNQSLWVLMVELGTAGAQGRCWEGHRAPLGQEAPPDPSSHTGGTELVPQVLLCSRKHILGLDWRPEVEP